MLNYALALAGIALLTVALGNSIVRQNAMDARRRAETTTTATFNVLIGYGAGTGLTPRPDTIVHFGPREGK